MPVEMVVDSVGKRIPEEQLAIFRDVVEQLNLDDFGGKRQVW